MRRGLYIAICFGLLISGVETKAQQDIHFSQFVSSPLNINPALAGIFDGDLRIANNYRNQWSSVSSPYKTISAGIDGVLSRPKGEKGILGGGLNFYNDIAGDSEMTTTNVGLTVAYHLPLTDYQYLSFGLQGGPFAAKAHLRQPLLGYAMEWLIVRSEHVVGRKHERHQYTNDGFRRWASVVQ